MAVGHVNRDKESEKKSTRYFSNKQEKFVTKIVDGKQTLNSGATPFQKGDILTKDFLIECKTKTTHSNSISIKKEWFNKNKQEMVFEGKQHQALVFNFGPDEENHYIIDEYLFQELIQYLENKNT